MIPVKADVCKETVELFFEDQSTFEKAKDQWASVWGQNAEDVDFCSWTHFNDLYRHIRIYNKDSRLNL